MRINSVCFIVIRCIKSAPTPENSMPACRHRFFALTFCFPFPISNTSPQRRSRHDDMPTALERSASSASPPPRDAQPLLARSPPRGVGALLHALHLSLCLCLRLRVGLCFGACLLRRGEGLVCASVLVGGYVLGGDLERCRGSAEHGGREGGFLSRGGRGLGNFRLG